MSRPVILYLHGFASGPGSTKGRALEERFTARGVPFHRADLTPGEAGFEASTPLTMLAEAERLAAVHRPRVLMGSSLGGYLAALLASRMASAGAAGEGCPGASGGNGGAGSHKAAPTSRLHAGAAGEGCPGASGEHEGAAGSGGPLVSIARVVLLAPAFRLFERWRARLSPADEARWRQEGLEVWHYGSGRSRRLGWRFMEDAATLPAFPQVGAQTLCLTGRRDEVVPLEDVERFVALSPRAKLVVLEDGHELVASIDRIFEEAWAFLEPVLFR